MTYEGDGRVARITLDRPERGNGITLEMPRELAACVERANLDPEVHVIALAGNGTGFCGGYDLVAVCRADARRPPRLRLRGCAGWTVRRWTRRSSPRTTTPSGVWDPVTDYQMMSRNVRGFMSLFHSEKPVVCKVHGYCVAGGTDMALCSDLLVVEDRAKIGYPPARVWGVPTTALWAHKLGPTRAKRMLLTGDSISGREAVDWGLATDWAPAAELDAAFESLLERVARMPINQLVMHKLLVNQTVAAQGLLRDPGARHLLRRDRPPHARGPRVRSQRRRGAASRRRCASATSRSATSASTARSQLDLKILITSSRMPFALGMVRQLSAAGHEVYSADDYKQSPGSHSKYLAGHFVYPSSRNETEAFIDELERIIGETGIDVVVPAFEEAFFISTQRERLSKSATIFAGPFPALARLHDKAAFERLVRELGLPIPETVVATSDAELAEAIGRFDRYFGRAVFSRGGVDLLTNTGPLAGALEPAAVPPDARQPWVIQPFVEGETVCTYSTVHGGHGQLPPDVPDPAPVASLDRDPVRVDRGDASRCG